MNLIHIHFVQNKRENVGSSMPIRWMAVYICTKCSREFRNNNEKTYQSVPCPSCSTNNYPLSDVSITSEKQKTQKIGEFSIVTYVRVFLAPFYTTCRSPQKKLKNYRSSKPEFSNIQPNNRWKMKCQWVCQFSQWFNKVFHGTFSEMFWKKTFLIGFDYDTVIFLWISGISPEKQLQLSLYSGKIDSAEEFRINIIKICWLLSNTQLKCKENQIGIALNSFFERIQRMSKVSSLGKLSVHLWPVKWTFRSGRYLT